MGSRVSAEVLRGAHYPPWVLAFYDIVVHGISNPWIWRCPTALILDEFRRHATPNHLDVGVATGYYLRRGLSRNTHRVGLVDLSDHSLRAAAHQVRRVRPELYKRNVLEPLALDCEPFSSISMNYLLHCIPGNLKEKGVAITHAMEWLEPKGVLFGSTILTHGVERSSLARTLMAAYNGKGLFHNSQDSLADLRSLLFDHLEEVNLEVHGCVGIFSGTKPR